MMEITVVKEETEKAVKQCYLDMYLAMIDKDSTGLARVLDDSFVLVHMTGMRQPKEEFIHSVLNGTLNYYTAEHEDIRLLEVNEDCASIVGKTRTSAAVFGGGRHTWRLRQDIDLKKRNGQWLIVEARASTY